MATGLTELFNLFIQAINPNESILNNHDIGDIFINFIELSDLFLTFLITNAIVIFSVELDGNYNLVNIVLTSTANCELLFKGAFIQLIYFL